MDQCSGSENSSIARPTTSAPSVARRARGPLLNWGRESTSLAAEAVTRRSSAPRPKEGTRSGWAVPVARDRTTASATGSIDRPARALGKREGSSTAVRGVARPRPAYLRASAGRKALGGRASRFEPRLCVPAQVPPPSGCTALCLMCYVHDAPVGGPAQVPLGVPPWPISVPTALIQSATVATVSLWTRTSRSVPSGMGRGRRGLSHP